MPDQQHSRLASTARRRDRCASDRTKERFGREGSRADRTLTSKTRFALLTTKVISRACLLVAGPATACIKDRNCPRPGQEPRGSGAYPGGEIGPESAVFRVEIVERPLEDAVIAFEGDLHDRHRDRRSG